VLSVSACVVSSATPPIPMPDGAVVCRAVPRHTSKRRANMAPMRWAVFGHGARRRRRGPGSKSPDVHAGCSGSAPPGALVHQPTDRIRLGPSSAACSTNITGLPEHAGQRPEPYFRASQVFRTRQDQIHRDRIAASSVNGRCRCG
jgi:hypothetical protein